MIVSPFIFIFIAVFVLICLYDLFHVLFGDVFFFVFCSWIAGTGNREEIHDLGFDCSDGFHEYVIKWYPHVIEWLIDGKLLRKDTKKKDGEGFPEKPMFLYASVWDVSYIDEGRWTGPYVGCDAPYVCHYKDVVVPSEAAVVEDFSC